MDKYNLRELRRKSGIKCSKIAEKLKVSRGQVYKIEQGTAQDCKKYIPVLAKIYNKSENFISKCMEGD